MAENREKINLTQTQADSSCPPPEFFKVFIPDHSSHQLQIPPAFKKHLEKKVPQKSTIKSPANRTWTVNLEQEGSDLFFKEGWQEFVKDHTLQYGDFLTFQYDGNSSFNVNLYCINGCLKEISVVANCSKPLLEQTPEEEKEVLWDRRNTTDDPNAKMDRPENECLGKQFVVKSKRGRPRKADQQCFKGLLPGRETPQVQQTTIGRKRARPLASGHTTRNTTGDPNAKMERLENECLGGQFVVKRKRGRPRKALAFGHNMIAAIAASNRYESEYPSCKVVLTPACFMRSEMAMPSNFVRRYIPGGSRDIYLQVSDRLWLVRLCVYPNWFSRLSRGWAAFAKDNHLQIGDPTPPALQKYLKEPLPQKSTIWGPGSGNQTWTVNLERQGSNVVFKEGWPEFVKDHHLEFGDFIVFQHDGRHSSFSFKIFGKTGCMKEIIELL